MKRLKKILSETFKLSFIKINLTYFKGNNGAIDVICIVKKV